MKLRLKLTDPANLNPRPHFGQAVVTGIVFEEYAIQAVDLHRQALSNEDKPRAEIELRAPLPFAERLMSYFYWHYSDMHSKDADAAKDLPGRSYSNCHTLTAALQNWVTPDELNPNIIGSGTLRIDHIYDMDPVVVTDPNFVLRPGEAYGIPRRGPATNLVGLDTFQVDIIHTFTPIDPKGDLTLSVAGWAGPIVLESLPSLQQLYAGSFNCSDSVIGHIPTKPKVIDSEIWFERLGALHGGGRDGKLETIKLEGRIEEKPRRHQDFAPRDGHDHLQTILDAMRDSSLRASLTG